MPVEEAETSYDYGPSFYSALSIWKIPPDRLSIARGLVRFAIELPSNILMVILLELLFMHGN